MTKSYRQGQILKLIRAQADLTRRKNWRRSCKSQGIAATQVTLSRDIRDLRLVKTREGYQEMAAEETGPAASPCWPASSCSDVLRAQNLVVLKTVAGPRQFGRGRAR